MMGVVGPNAEAEMLRWKETIKDATPAADSRDHLIAAAFAADPNQVQPLLKGAAEGQVDPAQFFNIRRVREPTRVVVQQQPDRYRAVITGPKAGAARVARGPEARTLETRESVDAKTMTARVDGRRLQLGAG